MQNCEDDVGKLRTTDNHVQLKTPSVASATEKAILQPSAYQTLWQSSLNPYRNQL